MRRPKLAEVSHFGKNSTTPIKRVGRTDEVTRVADVLSFTAKAQSRQGHIGARQTAAIRKITRSALTANMYTMWFGTATFYERDTTARLF